VDDAGARVEVTTDRPDAIYGLGEQVTFLATVEEAGETVTEGELQFAVGEDGMQPSTEGTLPLSSGSVRIPAKLEKPGFLQCRVSYEAPDGRTMAAAIGAGVKPLSIEPSLPPPDDFDSFWDEQRARLAAVPLDATVNSVPSPVEEVECFDIRGSCTDGVPVSGYLAMPRDAKPRSLAALLTMHGAGVGPADRNVAAHAQHGLLALDINAHGLPNDQPAEYYQNLTEGELQDYRTRGREQRESIYFLGMFLRLKRALDLLTSRPEWDGQVLIVRGSSQGGAQALAGAGLDGRVTGLAAGVPAMCDHTGHTVGRASGWPKFVSPNDPDELRQRVAHASRYFDMVNFAARTEAEAVFSVGFLDAACNPTTVYAAYNALPGPKRIINRPSMGHEAPEDIGDEFTKWTLEHIESRRNTR